MLADCFSRLPHSRGSLGTQHLWYNERLYFDSVMLLFKKKFLEQIKRGEKTQTIRLWEHRRMKPGQRSYVPGVGYIAITSVEPVELSQLTDADALLDGFPTAETLRTEIHTLYEADARENLTPYRIRFSVYPPQEQQKIAEERQIQKEQKKQCQQKNRDTTQEEFVVQTLDKLLKISETADTENEPRVCNCVAGRATT